MAYRVEKNPITGNPEIVIDGVQQGISASPYVATLQTQLGNIPNTGIADCRNLNIITIPGEASVIFSTTKASLSSFSGSVASADAAADTITYSGETGTPVSGMAVVFAGGALPAGVSAGTQSASADTNVYWISNIDLIGKTFKIYTTPALSSPVNITGNGTGTFASIDMSQPRQYTIDNSAPSSYVYYIQDWVGRVWKLGTNWIFMGNTTRTNSNGNGLVYYRGYIFAMSNAKIDYMKISTGAWSYAWVASTGTSGAGGNTFYTANGIANSHYSIVGQDDVVYICDSHYLASFFEKVGSTFDPTDITTYTWAGSPSSYALLFPVGEISQWLAELGVNLMTAGVKNLIYPWDRTSTSFTYPIFLSEHFGYADLSGEFPIYPRMVTIDTNSYIFVGNRGRIYITNGTNAQLAFKIPDHLSGTVEPYFYWGGVGFNKNQLYFGAYATTNTGSMITAYGGVWAIDMDTKAMRLVNVLSYGTYAGYATVYIPNTTAGSGSSFFVGWDSGATTYGMDSSSSTPYSNYESYFDSDMIPVGTITSPFTPTQVEFKLTTPLVSGEGVKISYRTNITASYTLIGETTTTGTLSDYYTTNFQNAQWVQLRTNTKSTSSNPSYTRLREIRLRAT